MRITYFAIGAAALLLAACQTGPSGGAAPAAAPFGPFGVTGQGTANIATGDLAWRSLFGPGGPDRAVAFGDPATGPHGFYLRLPPVWESGWHTHSGTYHAVVIEGRIANLYRNQPTDIVLGPGGYFATQGGVAHNTKCLSETPCVVYVQIDAAFDAPPAP